MQFILSCAHAQAFYGCEASSVDESALKSYTSLLLQVSGTNNTHHARALVFAFLDGPLNIDPIMQIFTQRAMMMRRAIIKIPSIAPIVSLLFTHYQRLHMPGTHYHGFDLSSLSPAPMPGGERCGAWKWRQTPPGPVGLLLENTHLLDGSLQFVPFIFRTDFSANINMFSDPYNHLQPSLHDFGFHAVQFEASRTRTILHECPAVDKLIYRTAVASLPNDVQGAVYGVSTFSIADQAYIHELDNHQSSLCVFCCKCQS